jgi:hypothetical protein
MKRIFEHLRRNLVAYLALFVALGGTSYAAFSLPKGSVGTAQLRNHSVTPIKLDARKIGAYVRAWAVIQNGNKVIAARPRAQVTSWDPAFAAGVVSWGSAISRACFPLASGGRDFIQAAMLQGPGQSAVVHYQVYNNSGQFDSSAVITYIAVACPQP